MREQQQRIRRLVCDAALLILLLLPCWQTISQAEEPSVYEVKAALIFNFLKFMEVPRVTDSPEVTVCTLSAIPDFDPLSSIAGKEVNGKALKTTSRSIGAPLAGCQVIFVHESASKNLAFLKTPGSGILTVGESSDFCKSGGIVNFFLQDQKVRFEINSEAAGVSGVTVSSKLMRIAGALTQPTAIPVDK